MSVAAQLHSEAHLEFKGRVGIGRGETITQMVTRWRDGYCGAALANRGFMSPWKSTAESVRPAYVNGTHIRPYRTSATDAIIAGWLSKGPRGKQ